jgi:hypothetical protein
MNSVSGHQPEALFGQLEDRRVRLHQPDARREDAVLEVGHEGVGALQVVGIGCGMFDR